MTDMKSRKLLSLLKWILITFLIFFFCLEIYQISIHHNLNNKGLMRLATLLVLISIFLFKNKYTWIFGIILFTYSMYEIIVNVKYAQPAAQDFTSTFHDLFRNHVNRGINIFLQSTSIYFYLIALLSFSTYPVRRWYKISSKRPPQIKPYL
jgi:hypothetical protein